MTGLMAAVSSTISVWYYLGVARRMRNRPIRWRGVADRFRALFFLWLFVAVAGVLGLCGGACSVWADAPGAVDSGLTKRLDAVLDEAVAQKKIVGAVVVVARNGQVVYQRAVGMPSPSSSSFRIWLLMVLSSQIRTFLPLSPLVSVGRFFCA